MLTGKRLTGYRQGCLQIYNCKWIYVKRTVTKLIDILQIISRNKHQENESPSLGKVRAAKGNGTTLSNQCLSSIHSIKTKLTKRLASVQHLGALGQDLSYGWPGVVSRAHGKEQKNIQASPISPMILAALRPRASRIGSTVLSRGVVKEPQQR